jgi:hypothetical protein
VRFGPALLAFLITGVGTFEGARAPERSAAGGSPPPGSRVEASDTTRPRPKPDSKPTDKADKGDKKNRPTKPPALGEPRLERRRPPSKHPAPPPRPPALTLAHPGSPSLTLTPPGREPATG